LAPGPFPGVRDFTVFSINNNNNDWLQVLDSDRWLKIWCCLGQAVVETHRPRELGPPGDAGDTGQVPSESTKLRLWRRWEYFAE
jgi:hypothetical protein